MDEGSDAVTDSNNSNVDFRLVCRTCLAADAEFYKLDAPPPILCEDDEEKVSMLDCLRYCTRLENVSQFPIYICTECSTALQVAYNFIRNALDAHEILRQKLCPLHRNNGLHKLNELMGGGATETRDSGGCEIEKVMRYRCKICNEKLETRQLLKEHVKLHSDIISYACQLCEFESKKRSHLSDHYTITHDIQPTREHLRLKTFATPTITITATTKVKAVDETGHNLIEQTHLNEFSMPADKLQDNNSIIPIELVQPQQIQVQSNQARRNILLDPHQIDLSALLSTSDSNHINAISNELQEFGNDFNIGNEISVGNEFIVMADGTVEEVMDNGVVIEYINATDADNVALDSDLVLDNIVQGHNVVDDGSGALINMDVDDIIIEESVGAEINEVAANIENEIPQAIITLPNAKSIKCKICAENFISQDALKTHMLSHNEIPHFFCEQCKFYTFFKIDLTQHYKTKHNIQPTHKQLQPKNKVTEDNSKEVFTCDMCLFETGLKSSLRRHYLSKHRVEATDIQLRPAIAENNGHTALAAKTVKPDYPNGLNCKKCNKVFYWRNKLKEHYKRHNMDENATAMELIQTTNAVTKQQIATTATPADSAITTTAPTTTTSPMFTQTFLTNNNINIDNNSTITIVTNPTPTSIATSTTTPTTTTAAAIAAAFTMPADAIPQIVETDSNIENDIDFDFNGDALFEDFDEDDDDEIECDDILLDAVLTSDDDFEDLLEEQNGDNMQQQHQQQQQRPYCIHCNKYFYSQYHFENHMFVHRGLAPYRCEMCTNLYNTKRALIRHYSAVHKKIPTRDMIQAKGDKVSVNITPMEYMQLEANRDITLMCAKCPYESTELQNLQIHLNTSHNITDENYILQKLPFECPRCIRSYANKTNLIRHLERSHSVATILETQPKQHSILLETKTTATPLTPTTAADAAVAATITSDRCGIGIELSETTPLPSSSSSGTTKTTTTLSAQAVSAPLYATIDINDVIATETTMPIVPLDRAIPNATQILSTETMKEELNFHTTADVMDDSTTEAEATEELAAALSPTTVAALKEEYDHSGYRCVACEYTCDTMEDLSDHSKLHPSDDSRENFNFQCAICDCKYKTIDLLKYHLKRHIARNYTCPECPKTFINRSELKNHRLIHSGAMPHKCDMCSKQFRYSHHLKRHKDVAHFGKRHQCPFIGCGRIFTTQAQLKIHAWNHNGNVPYKCSTCSRVFKKRELLRQHARKVHNINLTEEQIAEIYRNTVGYTNPHDFTVKISNGQMLRRSDVETICALPHLLQEDDGEQSPSELQQNEVVYELAEIADNLP